VKELIRGKEVRRRVISQGHSLMVTIPPAVIDELAIRKGDPVEIGTDGGRMIVEKVRRARDPPARSGGDTCQH
jgi:antitoxin component of MazEF toxin-antitoxin module